MKNLNLITFLAISFLFGCQSNPEGSAEQDSLTTEKPNDTVFHGIDGSQNQPVSSRECYLEVKGNDSLKLNIDINEGLTVTGHLEFVNYQMDSSRGGISGEIIGDTLIVVHEFQSEGTNNKVQRVFLKKNDQYYLGKGETEEVNGVYIYPDRSKINFNNTRVLDRIECDIT